MATAQSENTNGLDPTRSRQVLEEIEALHDDIRSLNEANSSKVAAKRQEIGQKYKEAKKAWGINTRALKAEVKARQHERKAAELFASLDEEDLDDAVLLRDALGDFASTALGRAAMGDDELQETEADIRSPAQKRRETERAARKAREAKELDAAGDNGAAKLAKGIKPTSPPTSH